MSLLSLRYESRHIHNRRAGRENRYGPTQRAVLDDAGAERARREIATWPGYAETPLRCLDGLAARSGLGAVWYKDEGGRFGLGSFKALGGAYAVARILIDEVEQRTGKRGITSQNLLDGDYSDTMTQVTVTCATDGNHGRSVAWGAQQFGCHCVIYIHATVSTGREQAIAAYGARVVRTEGNYDETVRRADADAAANGWVIVSDTSYPGYMEIPRHVMEGYEVMAEEAIEQLGDDAPPSHVFIPGGVGGFAAAVAAAFWRRFGRERPRVVAVEPEQAACIYESVAAGEPTPVHGTLDTIMAGLACGEVSLLAWEILAEGLDDVLVVPDGAAAECMRLLADGVGGDRPIVAGESAVAGLAGLLIALQRPDLEGALHLTGDSRVLLFGSEGATDPEVYCELVGRSPEEIVA